MKYPIRIFDEYVIIKENSNVETTSSLEILNIADNKVSNILSVVIISVSDTSYLFW